MSKSYLTTASGAPFTAFIQQLHVFFTTLDNVALPVSTMVLFMIRSHIAFLLVSVVCTNFVKPQKACRSTLIHNLMSYVVTLKHIPLCSSEASSEQRRRSPSA